MINPTRQEHLPPQTAIWASARFWSPCWNRIAGALFCIALNLAATAEAKKHSSMPPLFVSPMGEPFRASPESDARPFMIWFAGVDADHDGKVTSAELKADALRFFNTLDLDQDGELDPDEVKRYEDEIVPEIHTPMLGRSGAGGMAGAMRQGGIGRRGMPGGMPGGGLGGGMNRSDIEARMEKAKKMAENRPEGLELFGLLPIPEPVMSADTNLNRGVSVAEFEQAAQNRFGMVDLNKDGSFVPEEARDIMKARKRH